VQQRSSEIESTLHAVLAQPLGAHPVSFKPVHGGMICDAYRVQLSNGDNIFLKTSSHPVDKLFTTEAHSLRVLHEACDALPEPHNKVLCVPKVIAASDEPTFLALEWLPEVAPINASEKARQFGAALAALHRESTSSSFGWDESNYLGRLPQINTRHENWTDFYRECRLLPQLERAQRSGQLSPQNSMLSMRAVEKLPELLDDLDSRPSLLHGDLWSGNYFHTSQGTVIFDPACYLGEREMDVAYTELFGGFPQQFYDGYHSEYPLQAG
jgi:fructosamine-3-kinase